MDVSSRIKWLWFLKGQLSKRDSLSTLGLLPGCNMGDLGGQVVRIEIAIQQGHLRSEKVNPFDSQRAEQWMNSCTKRVWASKDFYKYNERFGKGLQQLHVLQMCWDAWFGCSTRLSQGLSFIKQKTIPTWRWDKQGRYWNQQENWGEAGQYYCQTCQAIYGTDHVWYSMITARGCTSAGRCHVTSPTKLFQRTQKSYRIRRQ